jgi:hypothetical protein
MVNEAERFAGEDKAKREAVETKNSAESMVYQTEKQIKERGDKVRARVRRPPRPVMSRMPARSACGAATAAAPCLRALPPVTTAPNKLTLSPLHTLHTHAHERARAHTHTHTHTTTTTTHA